MKNKIQYNLVIFVSLFINAITFSQSKKPNVIIFIADDFGYGSTNIYGAQEALIKTPNVNKLAKEGVIKIRSK